MLSPRTHVCMHPPPVYHQAARTNGAGILQLSRVFDSLAHPPSADPGGVASPPVVHLVTFSYNRGGSDGGGGGARGGFSPAQPVGSALRQLFWLCSQVWLDLMGGRVVLLHCGVVLCVWPYFVAVDTASVLW